MVKQPSSPRNPLSRLRFIFYLSIVVGLIMMVVGIGFLVKDFVPQLNASRPTQVIINTVLPTVTPETPTVTPSPAPTSTMTSTPLPYVVEINPKDQAEIVLVAAGEFMMGSDAQTDPYFWGAEGPEHMVYLDSFYIYRTEVTNGMYEMCVDANACPKPTLLSSPTRDDYFGNPQYSNYPAINVSWIGALSYCQWAEAVLPTEAQWEKAARGTDNRLFPWGNDAPTSALLNFSSSDTTEVGSYPQGISPYGALDMAGNVLEWVNDRFQSGYYSASPLENPIGPSGGSRRVIRGGAWHHSDVSAVRTVARASLAESRTGNDVGIRCVIPSP